MKLVATKQNHGKNCYAPENVLVVVEPKYGFEEWVPIGLRLAHQGLVELNQNFLHVDSNQGWTPLANRYFARQANQGLVVGRVPEMT